MGSSTTPPIERRPLGRLRADQEMLVMKYIILIVLSMILAPTMGFSPHSSRTRLISTIPTESRVGVRPMALRYRQGQETPQPTISPETKNNGWWKSLLHHQRTSEDSDKVDEYLEFLDKRYHRLHDAEKAPTPAPKFSALKWLQGGEEGSQNDQQEQQDDALFVLGVAGLASQRLLQKHSAPHSLPRETDRKQKKRVKTVHNMAIDAVVETQENDEVVFVETKQTRKQLSALIRWLTVQNFVLQRQQAKRLRTIWGLLNLNVFSAKKLWTLGGGSRNIAWTLTIMAAFCVCLVKPILEGVAVTAARTATF